MPTFRCLCLVPTLLALFSFFLFIPAANLFTFFLLSSYLLSAFCRCFSRILLCRVLKEALSVNTPGELQHGTYPKTSLKSYLCSNQSFDTCFIQTIACFMEENGYDAKIVDHIPSFRIRIDRLINSN